jgi:uncharacterized protein (TIGR00255 family)
MFGIHPVLQIGLLIVIPHFPTLREITFLDGFVFMLISMTGFGRASLEALFGRIVVEIHCVNRKYLEISTYLPKELNRFDMEIRKWVGESISRGQVSVRVFLTPSEDAINQLLPDPLMLKRLKKAWTQVAKASGTNPRSIDLPFLLQNMPASILQNSAGEEKDCLSALKQCIADALEGVSEMKRREGQALMLDIGQRLKELDKMVHKIEELAPQSVGKQREKLRERILEVLAPGSELDDRLVRELALFADRVDISEEIARFYSHISQFQEILKTNRGAVGRKLDFLVQEIGREINTIGSKSADAAITRMVVDGKSELEKVREQIQNIE